MLFGSIQGVIVTPKIPKIPPLFRFPTLTDDVITLKNQKIAVVVHVVQNTDAEFGHFTLLFCRERLGNVPRFQTESVEVLFYSLNLLLGDVLVAVAVVVCLGFLFLVTDSNEGRK